MIENKSASVKRLMIISASVGAGCVLTVALIWGAVLWYLSRRSHLQAWNSHAIVASFDDADVEKREGVNFQNILLHYTLENRTDHDYTLPNQDLLKVNARLKRQQSLSGGSELIIEETPLFLPAKERVRFSIHLLYPMEKQLGPQPKTHDDYRRRDLLVRNFVKEELPNLDGFVIFDPAQRYEIELPPGWR